jgi:hypothetical protein
LPAIDAEAVEGVAVSQLLDRGARHSRWSPHVLHAFESGQLTRANDLRTIRVRQATDLPQAKPNSEIAPAGLL